MKSSPHWFFVCPSTFKLHQCFRLLHLKSLCAHISAYSVFFSPAGPFSPTTAVPLGPSHLPPLRMTQALTQIGDPATLWDTLYIYIFSVTSWFWLIYGFRGRWWLILFYFIFKNVFLNVSLILHIERNICWRLTLNILLCYKRKKIFKKLVITPTTLSPLHFHLTISVFASSSSFLYSTFMKYHTGLPCELCQ